MSRPRRDASADTALESQTDENTADTPDNPSAELPSQIGESEGSDPVSDSPPPVPEASPPPGGAEERKPGKRLRNKAMAGRKVYLLSGGIASFDEDGFLAADISTEEEKYFLSIPGYVLK